VDVNVHPAKSEVRFLDPRFVRLFVTSVVKQGVWNNGLRAATWFEGSDAGVQGQANLGADLAGQIQDRGSEADSEIVDGSGQARGTLGVSQGISPGMHQEKNQKMVGLIAENQAHISWNSPSHQAPPLAEVPGMSRPKTPVYDPTIARENFYFMPKGTPAQMSLALHGHQASDSSPIFVDLGQALGQIQDSYIVARSKDGLVLVDPHAAHERIVYEHMKTQWADDVGQVVTFLIPVSWAITDCQYDAMMAAKDVMKTLGFSYQLDQNAVQLKTVPLIFQAYDPESLVCDLMTCMRDGDSAQDVILAWRNHMMANWACRQSIKLGQCLTLDAMNVLLRRLERTPHGAQCNHGRCVYRIWTGGDLARFFDR
jgi:DNA mismatch repair protein MutL